MINTGTDFNNRIGSTIACYDIEIQLLLTLGPSNTTYDSIRVVYFVDRLGNGIIPDYTDVFSTFTLTSFQNVNNIPRFAIFSDKIYNINDNNPNVSSRERFNLEPMVKSLYSISSGASIPLQGAIWVMALPINSVGPGPSNPNQSQIEYNSRIRYSDRSKTLKTK